MEMQCELLVSNFSDPKTIALVKENIGRIYDGSSPHCAGVLKLGLKKAFELKKQKRQPPGVLLRCTYTACAWYNNHATYAAAGSNVYAYCQNCLNHGWGGRYLCCVGCGYTRNGVYASCPSCGKKFL